MTRQIRRVVKTVGTLYPHGEVVVSAEAEDPVEQVRFDPGDVVNQGDPLVRISKQGQL